MIPRNEQSVSDEFRCDLHTWAHSEIDSRRANIQIQSRLFRSGTSQYNRKRLKYLKTPKRTVALQ